MKKRSTHISLLLTVLFGLASLSQGAPPILNYSGQVAVDGCPEDGQHAYDARRVCLEKLNSTIDAIRSNFDM